MTTYTLRKAAADKVRVDVLIVGITKEENGTLTPVEAAAAVGSGYGRKLAPLLASLSFKGGIGEVAQVPQPEPVKASRILFVGLGEQSGLTTERIRRAIGAAARSIGNAASVAIAFPEDNPARIKAVVEGFGSARYRFTAPRAGGKVETASSEVAEVVVLTEGARRNEMTSALSEALVHLEVLATVRNWVNMPPNLLGPTEFAAGIKEAVAGTGLRYKVYDEVALADLGCGGILGVGKGSDRPPRLVRLTWKPKGGATKGTESIALVGKGITYDSGGLSIKPGSSMATMKYDMAGAAAVAGAMIEIARLNLPINVTAYLPMAENMIGGSATRPGDVLTMHSGQTVEVMNTDAEGRLILADAISMAVKEKADRIVEASTLTGACIVALGDRVAGLFGEETTTTAIRQAADVTGEQFWPLPIPEEQRRAVREDSTVADLLQHKFVRWGSALYAAAFLEAFTAGKPWAHLDIAGPAFNGGAPWGSQPTGATGFAVATLVEFVRAASSPAAAS